MPLRLKLALNVGVTEDGEASGESAAPSARVSPVDTLVAAANARGGGGDGEARLLTARSPPRARPKLSLSVTARPLSPASLPNAFLDPIRRRKRSPSSTVSTPSPTTGSALARTPPTLPACSWRERKVAASYSPLSTHENVPSFTPPQIGNNHSQSRSPPKQVKATMDGILCQTKNPKPRSDIFDRMLLLSAISRQGRCRAIRDARDKATSPTTSSGGDVEEGVASASDALPSQWAKFLVTSGPGGTRGAAGNGGGHSLFSSCCSKFCFIFCRLVCCLPRVQLYWQS